VGILHIERKPQVWEPQVLSIDLYLEQNPAIAGAGAITAQDWQQWFQVWLAHLQHDANYEIALRLTDDDEIQKLNAQYRHQDRPTDVLAFAALEADIPELPPDLVVDSEIEPIYLGDIVISATTAAVQAQERDHSHRYELVWLAAHGLLHLLGWDHPDETSLERMLEQQDVLLSLINFREIGEFKPTAVKSQVHQK
jgi:probable rRNA maturation factor